MSMTEALLHKRLAETPEMEPCDGVKLLYQSRFGCGHLLPPDGQLVERIRAEADELPENAALPALYLHRERAVPDESGRARRPGPAAGAAGPDDDPDGGGRSADDGGRRASAGL